jgi:hypothetical protein
MMSDLTNIFAESSRSWIAVSMPPVNKLPSDVWLSIVETLDLLNLSRLCDAFTDVCLDADVPFISTSQALKELYLLLISGDNRIEVFIESDGEMCPRAHTNPKRRKVDPRYWTPKPYISYTKRNTNLSKSFAPASCSTVAMTLVATKLEHQSTIYEPKLHGAEPIEITRAIVFLSPSAAETSQAPSQLHLDLVELNYQADDRSRAITNNLEDVQHTPTSRTRTLSQNLSLSSASWRPKDEPFRTYPLPRRWFDFLGDWIRVSATMRKHNPSLTLSPLEWKVCSSYLQTLSISFLELRLPSARSLRGLFPPEVLNTETEDCSDGVVRAAE